MFITLHLLDLHADSAVCAERIRICWIFAIQIYNAQSASSFCSFDYRFQKCHCCLADILAEVNLSSTLGRFGIMCLIIALLLLHNDANMTDQFECWSFSCQIVDVCFMCPTSPSPSPSSLALLLSSVIVLSPEIVIISLYSSHQAQPKSVNCTTCQVSRTVIPAHKAPVSLFSLIPPWDFCTISALAEVLASISLCSWIFNISSDYLSWKGESVTSWKWLLN